MDRPRISVYSAPWCPDCSDYTPESVIIDWRTNDVSVMIQEERYPPELVGVRVWSPS